MHSLSSYATFLRVNRVWQAAKGCSVLCTCVCPSCFVLHCYNVLLSCCCSALPGRVPPRLALSMLGSPVASRCLQGFLPHVGCSQLPVYLWSALVGSRLCAAPQCSALLLIASVFSPICLACIRVGVVCTCSQRLLLGPCLMLRCAQPCWSVAWHAYGPHSAHTLVCACATSLALAGGTYGVGCSTPSRDIVALVYLTLQTATRWRASSNSAYVCTGMCGVRLASTAGVAGQAAVPSH